MLRSLLSFLTFAACLPAAFAAESVPLVISSNPILNDMVKQVGGDRVQAVCLIRPGVDFHSYEAKPGDVRLLATADLVVMEGPDLESWFPKLIANSSYRGPVLTASKGIDFVQPAKGGPDPHTWHDLSNALTYTENIREAMAQIRPDYQETYRLLSAAYADEIRALHAWALAETAKIPPARRKAVTSHNSFAYFARAYGLEIRSIGGLDNLQEPSARQVAQIIDYIRREGVTAVFSETGSNPKVTDLIAREAGARVASELFADTLGPPDELSGSYLGMFKLNVLRILRALR